MDGLAGNPAWRLFTAPFELHGGPSGCRTQAKGHRNRVWGPFRAPRGTVPVLSPSEAPRDSVRGRRVAVHSARVAGPRSRPARPRRGPPQVWPPRARGGWDRRLVRLSAAAGWRRPRRLLGPGSAATTGPALSLAPCPDAARTVAIRRRVTWRGRGLSSRGGRGGSATQHPGGA